jgi:hypothetical protein
MGFMQSPEYVYNVMQTAGEVAKWARDDWFTFFSKLTAQGFIWDPEDTRLRQKGVIGLTNNTPWCHVSSSHDKHCSLDHNVIYNNWRIIHPRCLECWKTVVAPRTFHELLLLEGLQKQLGFDSKCGIEMRDYTPRHYGGYFYSSSLDEGRARYKEVKEAVSEVLSPEVGASVILKRGCTEYEMGSGPSLYWNINRQQEEMLKIIEAFVDVRLSHGQQSSMLQRNVHMKWVLWAHANGDMSYVDYNGGKKLFPGYVSYHENDIGDVKHDLAIARMQAATGLPPETSDKFLDLVQEFSKEYKIKHYGELARVLGSNYSSPLDMKFGIKVAEEAKGDLDETT